MIYDRRGDAVRGMVFFMAKVFVVEGNPGGFFEAAGPNTIVVQKNTPTYKGSFLIVTTTPEYVKFSPRELIAVADNHCDEIEKRATDVRSKTGDFAIKLVEAKYADLENTNELFGEPLALPALVVRKEGPGLESAELTGRVHLGQKLDGEKSEEDIKSFLLTTLSGADTTRGLHVMMEGCVINGVSGVVFDGFQQVDSPNANTDEYGKYGLTVDPMGMPVRRFKPGADFFIDLKLLNKDLFGDIVGAGHGVDMELIGEALEKKPFNLKGLIELLRGIKAEDKKFFGARAIRICRLMEVAYPGLFDGALEPKEIVAPWLKKMGRIAVVDTRGMKPSLKKGLVYCTLKTLYESYKKEFASSNMKVLVVVSDPDLVGEPKSLLDREANRLIKLSGETGIGVCAVAKARSELDPDIRQNSTLAIEVMEGNNASVNEHGGKPYRISFRPTLSAV
ncbi:hypothetical protein ACFLQ2_01015 [archaeon]